MRRIVFLLACILFLLTACSPQAGPAISPVEAQLSVSSIEVLKVVSVPLQVRVLVKGSLPGTCYQLGPEAVNSASNFFVILLQAKQIAGSTCSQADIPFERVITLDHSDLHPGTYQIEVNGVKASFELSAAESGMATAATVSVPPLQATPTAQSPSQATQEAAPGTSESGTSPSSTKTPAHPAPTESATPSTPVPAAAETQTACLDQLIFLSDVTIPDFSAFAPGKSFTKTWSVQNAGSCAWNSAYSLAFLSGEQMGGPDHVSLPVANPGDVINVSVNLTAPLEGKGYTSNWQFLDPLGKRIPILGNDVSYIWLKINVDVPAPAPDQAATASAPPVLPSGCVSTPNADFEQKIVDLINQERADHQLSRLTINSKLSAAALDHSLDMSCNHFTDHPGTDGSLWDTRAKRRGYQARYIAENVAAGSLANGATAEWVMQVIWADQTHQANILNLNVTEIGVSYMFSPSSGWGYITVDFARPGK